MAKAPPTKVLVPFMRSSSGAPSPGAGGWTGGGDSAHAQEPAPSRGSAQGDLAPIKKKLFGRRRTREATTQRCHRTLREVGNYPGFFLPSPRLEVSPID